MISKINTLRLWTQTTDEWDDCCFTVTGSLPLINNNWGFLLNVHYINVMY